MKETSLNSKNDLAKTKPEQLPQFRKGEQVLQLPSLWSCG
jgi:hypothetical protein